MFDKHLETDDMPHSWYGKLKGLNTWSGKDAMIVGLHYVSPYVSINRACACYADDPNPIKRYNSWPKRPTQICNTQNWVNAAYHPDPRVEPFRYMDMEGEQEQAIARTRPTNHSVKVVMLSKSAVKVPVDEVVHTYEPILHDVAMLPRAFATAQTLLSYKKTQSNWSRTFTRFKQHYHFAIHADGTRWLHKDESTIPADAKSRREPLSKVRLLQEEADRDLLRQATMEDVAMVATSGLVYESELAIEELCERLHRARHPKSLITDVCETVENEQGKLSAYILALLAGEDDGEYAQKVRFCEWSDERDDEIKHRIWHGIARERRLIPWD